MRERQGILDNVDGILFLTWLLLAVAGCFAIFSAISHGEWIGFFDSGNKHFRQIIFLGLSLVMMLIVLSLDYHFILQSSPAIYVACLLLLIATLFIGVEINGSKSWIRLGSFQIQPAEITKTGTALFLGYWFQFNDNVFQRFKTSIPVYLIIGFPMVLILLQGDMGSMLTFCMLIFVLFREGFTPIPIYFGFSAIAITLFTLAFGSVAISIALVVLAILTYLLLRNRDKRIWKPIGLALLMATVFSFSVNTLFHTALKDYQKDRVLVILGLKEDLHGAGYNLWQSKMAVGSGGFSGKGYLQGVQTQNEFVPEVSTDYIFSSIGEEFGFLGSIFVIGLFCLLIFRILHLAERQRSTFSRVFMYCAASFFTVHVFINIGMVIGIFPTAGIPLPFFSYGGSSLLSFSLLIALVLRLDSERLFMLS